MKNCLQRTSSRADPSQADPSRSEPSRAEPAEFFHSDSIGSAVKKSGSGPDVSFVDFKNAKMFGIDVIVNVDVDVVT